ncbi:MAG TPA: TatD family hydrolase, partial [Candidatus Andersenbacteria bacterium]|nr:TatD family hydrolase [Candidatus Andersenbacteria bacterium]
ELPEVAKTIPLEAILVETDCPYLTPEPFRGKRNDPSLVRFVVEKLALLREMENEKIAEITQNNAENLFSV